MNLKDIIELDNAQIFAFEDFSEDIEISTNSGNKRTVKCSLQSDLVNFSANAGVSSPLCAYSMKIYFKTMSDMTFAVGGMITVNGNAYKIDDKRDEMGVTELSLSKSGRW